MQIGTRAALRLVRAGIFEIVGAHERQRRTLDGSRAAILMYHRVLPARDAEEGRIESGMYVTPSTFEHHMSWLSDRYRVLPLAEIVTRLIGGKPLPERACALTFDDGWRDNFEYAFPVLRERGIPATVFLVASRVGTAGGFWFDDLVDRLSLLTPEQQAAFAVRLGAPPRGEPIRSVLEWLKTVDQHVLERALASIDRLAPRARGSGDRLLLDWSEIQTMARFGIDFESHGLSHKALTALSPAEAEHELTASLRLMLDYGHARHRLLSYPFGAFSDPIRRLARACGYRAALTTNRGTASKDSDLWQLPRVGLHDDISRSRVEFHRLVPGRIAAPGGSGRPGQSPTRGSLRSGLRNALGHRWGISISASPGRQRPILRGSILRDARSRH